MTTILSAESLQAALSTAVADTRDLAPSAAHSVGVDVVEIHGLARLLEKAGERLARRLYTEAEQRFCDQHADRLASTLAGKEAVAKVLGTGLRGGVRWTDIEIQRTSVGRPYACLHGGAAEGAAAQRLCGVAVSLGHERDLAFAVAVGIPKEAAS